MDVGWPAAAVSHWDNLRLLFPSTTSKDGCDVSRVEGWGMGGTGDGGSREQCSLEQPVSLLWQVIKFEMPTLCTPGTGVEKMSRNSQTLYSQVSWHRSDKYRPHRTEDNVMCHLVFVPSVCASRGICLDVWNMMGVIPSPFYFHQ